MRLRILLIVCALAVVALAGLRHVDNQTFEAPSATGSQAQLSAQPPPPPSLPSAVGENVKTPTLSPTRLVAEWPPHVGQIEITGVAGWQNPSAAPGVDRPRSFPLLI